MKKKEIKRFFLEYITNMIGMVQNGGYTHVS